MSQSAWRTNLRQFSRARDGDDQENANTIADLNGGSDRAVVVLMGAHVEDALEDALLRRMQNINVGNTAYKELFVGDAPLASFSAKIRICSALTVIDGKTTTDLNILREMRNACAHSRRSISFETPELNAALVLLGGEIDSLLPKKPVRNERRVLFVGACILRRSIVEGNERPRSTADLFRLLDRTPSSDESTSQFTREEQPK